MTGFEDKLREMIREVVREELAGGAAVSGEKLLDVDQAAELAHVSPKTIRAWAAANRLKVAGRAGRRLRLRVADVLAAIAGAPPEPSPEDLARQAVADIRRGAPSRRRKMIGR